MISNPDLIVHVSKLGQFSMSFLGDKMFKDLFIDFHFNWSVCLINDKITQTLVAFLTLKS